MPGVNRHFRALVLFWLFVPCAHAQVLVNGRVIDENGVAVSGAKVEVVGAQAAAAVSGKDGRFTLRLESPGDYRIQAEREGFFRLSGSAAAFNEGPNRLTVTLNHIHEFTESVDVVYSPPAIDLDQPAEREELNSVEILTVPYPAPQDLRNAFPLFNGVVQDTGGRVHVAGGGTDQTSYSLNGFNITDPATGRFEARLNIDTVRSLDLETSRFAADKGRASAGAVNVETKMGDDRWRFGGTNFVPGVSTRGGLHVNKWTPRLEFSGPLARSRAWFHTGFDAFYDVDTIDELPRGENRARGLTLSDLSRFQVNLTPSNILTASFLGNYIDDRRTGLSFLNPLETTINRRNKYYLWSIKDQFYLPNGALIEVGFADSRGRHSESPQGSELYEITPFGNSGNYFVAFDRRSYRQQWIASAVLPPFSKYGSHQLRLGVDLERESFYEDASRHDYRVLRTDYSVARYVTFEGDGFRERRNFEGAHYFIDRWNPVEGLTVEAGLRVDWDQVVRDTLWSPRLSAAWAPRWLKQTKIAGGFGIFYDALSLGTLTRHQDQISLATFFDPTGLPRRSPVETMFLVNERELDVPRYRTSSLSAERRLPFDFYGKAAWTRRVGSSGFTFINEREAEAGGYYFLRNWRHDRYQALELSLRRTFGRFEWSAGYTRSSARTDAAVDYSLENPVFARQAPGPLPWDTPNRLLMWGWAPVPRRGLPRWIASIVGETDAAYLVEYRSGFPFSLVNDEAVMVGPPNARRLPGYFSINLHFERKFRALHYLWAWRFGFNNITNNGNPNVVNNNIDSPLFLTYGRGQSRAFTVRLRLLGRR